MKINELLVMIIITITASGCVTRSYFLSPQNASSNPYQEVPVISDSIRGANYLGIVLTEGGVNQNFRDNVIAFDGRFHRSNNWGLFGASYGASLFLGNYSVGPYTISQYGNSHYDSQSFKVAGSNQFFGTYGFNGSIHIAVPLPDGRGGEWRILGLETSFQKEFGNYYNFRKNLPDSNADVIFINNFTSTLGFYTDIIALNRKKAKIGYKISYGFLLNPESDYIKYYTTKAINPMTYFSNTLHFSRDRFSGFVQFNLSDRYAFNIQTGMSYQLGKKSK
jgi:hypothetical protein